MKNLFALYFYRLRHSKSFWIWFGIVTGLSFSICAIVAASSYRTTYINLDWGSFLIIVLSGLTIASTIPPLFLLSHSLVGGFLQTELHGGLTAQQIASGYSRKQIFVVSYLGGLAYSAFLYLGMVGGAILGFSFARASTSLLEGWLAIAILISLMVFLVCYTIGHFALMVCANNRAGVILGIGLVFGVSVMYSIVTSLMSFLVLSDPSIVQTEGYRNFLYVCQILFPTGQISYAYNNLGTSSTDWDRILKIIFSIAAPIVDLCYIAGFGFAGYKVFTHKDLR